MSICAELTHDVNKKPGLTHFYKAVESGGKLEILKGQESYKMDAFRRANCIAEFPENAEQIDAGAMVRIHPI